MWQIISSPFNRFWQLNPALLYGLAFLMGCVSAISWQPIFLFPIAILLLPLGLSLRFVLTATVFVTAFAYTIFSYQFPELPEKGVIGNATLRITSLSSASTHFGKRWVYKGTIQKFHSTTLNTTNVPFTLSIPQNGEIDRPLANQDYHVMGRLKKTDSGNYQFSVGKHTPWYPIIGTWSSAEQRFQAKKWLTQYLQQKTPSQTAATFLAGIATGEFDDRLMQNQFSRFGLQHIMAISGFHFSIVALFLSFLLRLFLGRYTATLLLITLLTGYFLFLGTGSSIMRAWVTVMIGLMGLLFKQNSTGLNSLGIALFIVLMVDPLQSQGLGFQFSFAATAAILLLYQNCDLFFQKIFTLRGLSEAVEMNSLTQHAYCLLTFFRQAFSLTLAVNLVALPITLYYFHKFPLLSIVYNLFFPFLVSISMGILIFGMVADIFFTPLGNALHFINSHYTQFVLNFTYRAPTKLDITWYTGEISLSLLILYLSCILMSTIALKFYLEKRSENSKDWTFAC